MKYTKYISGIVHHSGPLNLEQDQFKTLMNIIHLEGARNGIEMIKTKFRNQDAPHRYDILIAKIDDRINELSHDLSPQQLVESWFLRG